MDRSDTTIAAQRLPLPRPLLYLSAAAACFLALTACADMPTAPVAPAPPAPEPMTADASGPVFQGVFLGEGASDRDRIRASIEAFGERVGKAPALVKTFFRLGDDYGTDGWVGQVLREVSRAGSTNFVAMDLRWDGAPEEDLLAAVVAGQADDRIRATARGLGDMGVPVLVELGWEMNGDWDYPWQGAANGGAGSGPEAYVAAWRHIVDLFEAEGAANVRWVFSPVAGNPVAGQGVGPTHWNWYGHYYPGDGYVDYVGVHGFNGPSVWNTPFLSFEQLFDAAETDFILSDLHRRHPDKPILISEFACEESGAGDKAAWVREAYRAIVERPGVVGAIWFDMEKEADWRIESSRTALAAYRDAVSLPSIRATFDESSL